MLLVDSKPQVDASDLSGKVKYVSQQYTQGDPCELNEQPRSTEVWQSRLKLVPDEHLLNYLLLQ